jgi:predicted Zn-dependent protease
MPKRAPSRQERSQALEQTLDKAMLALRLGRLDEAERLARQVLETTPDSPRAAQILGHALLRLDRPAEAIQPLRTAARRADDPALETLLAKALGGAGRSDEAMDQLRQTTARRPAFPLAFLELGDQLTGAGRFDEAVAVFEAGLALAPDADVLRIGFGHLHLQRNDRAAARGLFAQVRAAAPQRHDAVVGLAKVLALDGDYAGAADLYRRALQLRPDDPVARIELGRSLLEMGERDAGEAALRSATKAAPDATGLAITALAAASHGRFFLNRAAAVNFLRAETA